MLQFFQAPKRLNDSEVQLNKNQNGHKTITQCKPFDDICVHLPCLSHGELDTLRVQYETE